ncbi:MAG TPA: hypothetical protein V6C72_05870 [Chroococcales cyanobacterium]
MLVLTQVSRVYGPVKVYLSNNAIRVENPSRDKVFLCKAPLWEALLCNEQRKSIYRVSFSQWSKRGIKTALALEDNDSLRNQPGHKESDRTYAGVRSTAYWYENPGRPGTKHAVYVLTNEFPVDKNAQRFLQAVFDLPWASGIPLSFQRKGGDSYGFGLAYNRKREMQTFLETSTVKKTQFDPKVFLAPVKYKAVSESEIFIDSKDVTDAYAQFMGN